MAQEDRNDAESRGSDRVETFALDQRRTLVIRPTIGDDAPLLEALFGEMDEDDQRRRFFTAWSPKGSWCRSWAEVAERGGFGVIAVVDDGEGQTPVGEAGYAMRSDGDGDLAVTVADDWRGWLGAYLLDRLVEHAAAHGVENLQADVLLENALMRRLLEHRGAVVLEHDGVVERLSISTTGDVSSWPELDDRPHVLVEAAGGRWSGEGAAKQADVAVAMCHGPTHRRRHGCPVLQGERCPLADGAQAIVVLLDPDDDSTRGIVDAHLALNPAIPVFVRRGRSVSDGCRPLTGDSAADLSAILSVATAATERSDET